MEDNNIKPDDKDEKRKVAAELRKANKPLMEKKRRERINTCLDQLKSILMDVTKKESSFYSKLEKADILEMTVKYLKSLKRQQTAAALSSDPEVMDKYVAGFNECTSEVTSYLNSIEGLTTDVRCQMINHLADSLHRAGSAHTSSHMTSHVTTGAQQISIGQSQPVQFHTPAVAHAIAPAHNNVCIISPSCVPRLQTAVLSPPQAVPIQLVPAKLPSGETVYVLANSQQMPIMGSNINIANSTTSQSVPIMGSNINMTNTTNFHDFSPQNVNQNVTVLNSVVHGGIMKMEQVHNPIEVTPCLTPGASILVSPSGSVGQPLYFTKSPQSSMDNISLTDESSSSAGPSSSFEYSTGDLNANNICVQPSLGVSRLSPVMSSPVRCSTVTSHMRVEPSTSPPSIFQQLVYPQPQRTCSHTVSRPLSRPSSNESGSNVPLPIATKDNDNEGNGDVMVGYQQVMANVGPPANELQDQTWRPW